MAKQWALGVISGMKQGARPALRAAQELGIPTVQLQYPRHLDSAQEIQGILAAQRETGIEITTVFCGFAGESYADIPTVRETVGLVPQSTRAERVAKIDEISRFAANLGVARVAAHIGCIPDDRNADRNHADYLDLVQVVRGICDDLVARNQIFALETGQETALALRHFLETVARPNLRVNFDPANMILYGNDRPIEAMPLLAPWIDGVHCKDGLWPTQTDALGNEVPFGEGQVGATAWLEALLDGGYLGPLTIEREIAGEAQKRDILAAKTLIESVLESRAKQEIA